jgi:putative restriction endonuclease
LPTSFASDRGIYIAIYPVWLRAEDRFREEFTVALDASLSLVDVSELSPVQRQYVERLTRTRLHQRVFHARVLRAYADRCAMCRLHHPELLDAAHIIPDTEPDGLPVVPNGWSLCKIHHAAYDANLIGVRPNLVIDVKRRLLDEIDGPMLRHGLQEMDRVKLLIPTQRLCQPDPKRLEVRYERFLAAS